MTTDNALLARLQALALDETAHCEPQSQAVARRVDIVRRALRRQAPPDSGLDYLLVCAGEVEEWSPLVDGAVVGRTPGAHIRPTSRFVSARHCRFRRDVDGWTVEDLGSKNGTLVNGRGVSRCGLRSGDTIQIADVVLVLVGGGEAK